MKERYYIKVPASPEYGVKGGFVPVDPSRLHIGLLTELYTLDPLTHQYVRAHGADTRVKTGLDTRELLERWQAMVEQVEPLLTPEGLAGEFAEQIQETLANLPVFTQLLAAGQLTGSSKALESIGYSLLAMAGISAKVSILEEKAAQAESLTGSMADALVENDPAKVYEKTAEALAISIDEGLQAYRSISRFEAGLESIRERIVPLSRNWSELSEPSSTWLRDVTQDLEDFCLIASEHLIDPLGRQSDKIDVKVLQAIDLIDMVKQRFETAANTRQCEWENAEEFLISEQLAQRMVKQLERCRVAVQSASKNNLDTFALATELVTEEEFAEWERLLSDPLWQSSFAITSRLAEKVEAIRQLLDYKPVLPDRAKRTVDRAQGYIDRIIGGDDSSAETVEPPSPDDGPDGIESLEPKEVPADKTADQAPAEEPDPDRLAELYEVMLAIGAIQYCKHNNFSRGTAESIVDLVEKIGFLAPDERATFKPAMKRILKTDSYFVGEGENRAKAWRSVDPREANWIQFKDRRGSSKKLWNFWRLVLQAQEAGLKLADKYNISEADVKEAVEERQQESLRKREAFKDETEE